jgi:hypothetical protein
MTTLCQSDVNFFYYIHTTDAKSLIHRYTLGLVVYIVHSSITYYIHAIAIAEAAMSETTDCGHPERKSISLNGRKSTPTTKFLGTVEAYLVCHIGPSFQISLIYAFIGCP